MKCLSSSIDVMMPAVVSLTITFIVERMEGYDTDVAVMTALPAFRASRPRLPSSFLVSASTDASSTVYATLSSTPAGIRFAFTVFVSPTDMMADDVSNETAVVLNVRADDGEPTTTRSVLETFLYVAFTVALPAESGKMSTLFPFFSMCATAGLSISQYTSAPSISWKEESSTVAVTVFAVSMSSCERYTAFSENLTADGWIWIASSCL